MRYGEVVVRYETEYARVTEGVTYDGYTEFAVDIRSDDGQRWQRLDTFGSGQGALRMALRWDAGVRHDPFTKWIEDHRAEYLACAGEHIALHPTRGIVAHSPSVLDVFRVIVEENLEGTVVVDYVPKGA